MKIAKNKFIYQDVKEKMLCRRAEGTRVIQIFFLKKIQERLEMKMHRVQ